MDRAAADARSGGRETSPGARELAERLREAIRVGRLVPGQRLIEADITRDTGASRGKVREALQRLEAEGLVSVEEFRGASVRRFSWDEVRQIYGARMALEGLAAGEFARAEAPEAKSALRSIQEELDRSEPGGDQENFARLNAAWHDIIIEGGGNKYVRNFLVHLQIPIYRMLFSSFYSAQRIDEANAGHRRITSAILDGRADDAERAMRDHVAEGFAALSGIRARFEG